MLKNCPECGLQVSDKAVICPHCGYPLKEQQAQKTYRKPSKRRRLPNGFGQISEMKGHNLRKPFRAMITVGKDSLGRPVCQTLKPIGYFETYNEAYTALVEYHKNPYDFNPSMSLSELYDKYIEKLSKEKSVKYVHTQRLFWEYVTPIHDMPVNILRPYHIKQAVEGSVIIRDGVPRNASPSTKEKIKYMLNALLDFGVELGIVDHNCARDYKAHGEVKYTTAEGHLSFTDNELAVLWSKAGRDYAVDMILIDCYTGWRPQELCSLTLENINLDDWIMTGGCKTPAGFNRIVPIHPKIKEMVRGKYQESLDGGGFYLFNRFKNGKAVSQILYNRYYIWFSKTMQKLNLSSDHRPHDCRKTFATLAKKYKMDEYAIKRIIGHQIDDLTERVYTDRPISWLIEEIEKIQ